MKLVLVGLAMIGIFLNSGNVMAEEQTVTLDVESMACPLCPVMVRKALEKTDGVKEAAVSYEQHRAVIIYDDEINIPVARPRGCLLRFLVLGIWQPTARF